jgi:myosin heavy subunit
MIGTVDEALTLCFDVSDDMKKVIAAKVHADELMSSPIMASPGGNGGELQPVNNARMTSNSSTSKPWASSPRMNNKPWDSASNRKLKPWEEPFSKRRPSVEEYMQQIEARIHRTYSNGTTDVSTNRSPFDEALVSPRLVRRKAMNQKETMPLLSSMSPRNNSQEVQEVNDGTPAAATEPSVQLFSGSEHLVKGLELIADNKRMTLELEQNKTELSRQKEEIEAFKMAMSEAETAVKMLEESVRELNEAIAAKDELIVELETEAKEGEVSSAEKQMAQQEQVKELGSAVSQLNLLVKEMEAESKEADVRLAEALQKCSESEAALKQLQLTMAKNEEEHAKLVQEMEKEKDELVTELEALKETMAASLENTTKQMDGIVKEKDKLIYTLSAKIEMLESTLEDIKEKKLEIDISAANKEKELNEKILDLATTLTEKDEKMAVLQKEVDDLKEKSSKIGKRAVDKDQRRHTARTKSRPWERPDDHSYRTRSSFGSEGSSRRRHLNSSNQRGRDNEDTRVARFNKKAGSSFTERVRYETPEPYEEEGRDDGYGYSYPERDAALFSPVDDDSYVYRRH